jgi:threonine/homoserine/homoserine lactone efflux protein
MEIAFLLKGIAIGFSIAAPVGPIGVLCIRRTLSNGRASGLISGLGAATADAIYGSIAGFGLTFISNFLVNQEVLLRLAGGAFLCFLGTKTFFSKASELQGTAGKIGLLEDYASTFALTVTNPLTIVSFAAVFAGLGLGTSPGDYSSALCLVSGVFAGSVLWWFLLSGGVGLFRAKFSITALGWVNRFSGVIIVLFGLLALVSLF